MADLEEDLLRKITFEEKALEVHRQHIFDFGIWRGISGKIYYKGKQISSDNRIGC